MSTDFRGVPVAIEPPDRISISNKFEPSKPDSGEQKLFGRGSAAWLKSENTDVSDPSNGSEKRP
jgi:hypothetical protein